MNVYAYQDVYDFMAECVHGDIYEIAHAQRVLCNGLKILDGEKNADGRVIILATLLHDIGRSDPSGDHVLAGSGKAYTFLCDRGYSEHVAGHVAECILTHRHKTMKPPSSAEAKILFDADKLDLMGAVGTARAIKQAVQENTPFYALLANGLPGSGKKSEPPSLVREYRKKLRKLPAILYTPTARQMAAAIRQAQDEFFSSLSREVERAYAEGAHLLAAYAEQASPQAM